LDLYISQELFDWIIELYPRELIPDDTDSTASSSSSVASSSDLDSSSSVASSSSLDSFTHSKTETKSTSNKNSDDNKYLLEGRLINGANDIFQLPTPLELLKQKFFEPFTVKPDDFDEKTAIYFNAGF
jgi:hypothetical protein